MIIGCAARLRGRPSSLKGRFALAARRPPAALDPGASAAPNGKVTAGRLCLAAPDARRPTRKSAKRSLYGLKGLPPAWPTLRAHLLQLSAETGQHPLRHLQEAARGRDLTTAGDMAAVLHWRLPTPASHGHGPLPWLAGIPTQLRTDPTWGRYLARRSQLVTELAESVRTQSAEPDGRPAWVDPRSTISPKLLGDITVWRAANGIDPQDLRPTGQPRLDTPRVLWQQHLDRAIAETLPPEPRPPDNRAQLATRPVSRRHDHVQPWRPPSQSPAPRR
jgi:hypothetical protein